MRNFIIESVKNYSNIYFDEDIEIIDSLDLSDSKCAKISLIAEKKFNIIIRITNNSLNKASIKLFGITNEEIANDFLKELANIIAGNIQNKIPSYQLSLPQLYEDCDASNVIYFKNSILEIAVSLKN
jgi:hypothetical protein